MFKMRLGWYAGVSTALAGAVCMSAFHQRANFYSAMVYLAQSNFCLLALVNFSLLLYSSFVYGLTRLCYGTLRAVEVEQLTERAWFAITETCLAMTIFREEIGAWFLVMFTALVTGKVWGWIGDGRVEFLEQQPPPNPRLFHVRLSISLAMSFLYDIWILRYAVHNVIQQARPNMMVMFLFEFAVLATCSWRTGARYILVLAEQNIIKAQTRKRVLERRQEVREQREAILGQRQQAAGEEAPANNEPLPSEDDVDEMDIEVPGWATKGEWVLWLDLLSDMIKLGIYVAFFFMLLMFYGLPIHIMRDLFMTSRDFIKRLHALLRYRRAIQEMNRYPDATAEDLAQENTCIICREEMRPWDPVGNPGAIDRVRPKKLPCSHILHLGCLKSWLERQQVCPTCRSPVTADRAREAQNGAAGFGIQIGGAPRPQAQQAPVGNDEEPPGQGRQNEQQQPPRGGGPRIFNLGPIRLGFGGNNQQVRELAQQFGVPHIARRPPHAPAAAPTPTPTQNPPTIADNLQSIGNLIQQSEHMVQREMQRLHMAQQELQIAQLLMAELQRLQHRRQQPQDQAPNGPPHPPGLLPNVPMNLQFPSLPHIQVPTQGHQPQFPGLSNFPGAPSRSGSPLMARLGATGSPPAIPAGSAELPEGVALPPGWSLMPLQRMDGAPSLGQLPPQAGAPLNGESSTTNRATNESTAPVSMGAGFGDAQAAETPFSATPPEDPPRSRPTEPGHGARTAEPPAMVAPSPVMPSWGGSAQLANSAPRVGLNEIDRSQADTAGLQTPEDGLATSAGPNSPPNNSKQESSAGEYDDDEEQADGSQADGSQADGSQADGSQADGSSPKGKGRAVTMEEARDDEKGE